MKDVAQPQEFLNACRDGHFEVIKDFLEKPTFNIDFKNKNGDTGLIIATRKKHNSIADLLINNGANLDVQGYEGWTALLIAAQDNNIEVVESLTKNGANLNITNDLKKSPLRYAIWRGYLKVIDILIRGGVQLNDQDQRGWTPLIEATRYNKKQIIEKLVKHGASLDITDRDVKSAYDYAHGNIPVMFILDKSILSRQDAIGDTLLITSCRRKKEDDILFLVRKGADIHFKNILGESAIDVLMKHDDLPAKLQAFLEKTILEIGCEYNEDEMLRL